MHRGRALVRPRPGRSRWTRSRDVHVELVLGSLQASPELIAEAIASFREVPAGLPGDDLEPARRRGGRRADGRQAAPAAVPERGAGSPSSPRPRRRRCAPASSRRPSTSARAATRSSSAPNPRKVHGYLAGTDAERAADLQWALTEPGIDMVHALEGGYGTARLHPLIDWDAVGAADPRIVCGFSDLTALHLFIATHTDWVSFYGPSFLRFTRTKGDYSLTEETEECFHRALAARAARPRLRGPGGALRADPRRRRRRGAARRRLPDPALLEHRHPVRGRDRGLRSCSSRTSTPSPTSSTPRSTTSGSRASSTGSPASPSAPASTSSTRPFPRAPSRRSRSRRSSTS